MAIAKQPVGRYNDTCNPQTIIDVQVRHPSPLHGKGIS